MAYRRGRFKLLLIQTPASDGEFSCSVLQRLALHLIWLATSVRMGLHIMVQDLLRLAQV